MEIIEYEDKYRKNLEDLMYQLEKFLMKIDSMKKAIVTDDYKKVYIDDILKRVKEENGKIYMAIENNKIIGIVIGVLISYSNVDATCYDFNKEGEIMDIIIDSDCRGKNIGTCLINRIEEYFRSCNCDIIRLNAFAENKGALEFYKKEGYSIRNVDFIKKLS